jgi:hypothetical protein
VPQSPLMKSIIRHIALVLLVISASLTLAQASGPSVLPKAFAGWQKTSGALTGTEPSEVDQANPAVLKEYGFTGFESATYERPGRTLKLKVARFNDATGAYGAFTFYRDPRMNTERVGTMAASANERVLFFRDNLLVEAQFDRVTAMSASELRELAAALPAAQGNSANLPTLPNYLPREDMVTNSAKYVVGPLALEAVNAPLSVAQIDFSLSPEIIISQYNVDRSPAQLILVAYPTPQIAGEKLRAIEAAAPQQDGTTIVAKRTGPILGVVKGMISSSDAKSILGRVNYEAEVTWNENTGLSKRDNIGNLIVAAFVLIGIILIISLGTGVLFGFGRVVLQRIFPERFARKTEETDIIRLNLR